MATLFEELQALVRQLEADQIEYALCGGLVHSIYGTPRATVDIDLLIRAGDWKRFQKSAAMLGFTGVLKTLRFGRGKVEIRRLYKVGDDREQLVVDALVVTAALIKIWRSRCQLPWENGYLSIASRDGVIMLSRICGRRGWPTSLAYLAVDTEQMNGVDMSRIAVTARLVRASQLRDLCLSLGRAGEKLRASEPKIKLPSKPTK